MKGLPPSETMLRREMRVCSVDLGKDAVSAMDGTGIPKSPSAANTKLDLLGEMNEILQKQGYAESHGRKIKGTQDSEMLVMEAISKLQLRGAEDDSAEESVRM